MANPSRLDARTTAQVVGQASASFLANLHAFLLLSLLLFFFRSAVETGSHLLSSFLDREPSVQTLVSRLSDPPPSHPLVFHHRRRRGPLLHLIRVGTIDTDFFSDDDDDHQLRRPPANGSSLHLPSAADSLRLLEIAGSGGALFFAADGEDRPTPDDRPPDPRALAHAVDVDSRDAATLLFLVTVLSAAYFWVVLGFLFSYCCVLGVVFFAVVTNSLLARRSSALDTLLAGSRLGMRRLAGFVLLRWAVRDTMTQFLGLWFFSDVDHQISFFKLFIKLKLMPFSVFSPWAHDATFDASMSGFLLTWVLLDSVVDFVFAIDCWVAILDTRRSGQEIVKEGCYLMSTMFHQALGIKCLELVLGGSLMRWLLTLIGGKLFALFLLSLAEVYFMVVWLRFYFAARCKDADLEGRWFGQRDLEVYIDGLR